MDLSFRSSPADARWTPRSMRSRSGRRPLIPSAARVVGGVLVGLISTGCGPSEAPDPEGGDPAPSEDVTYVPPPGPDWQRASPADVGMSEDLLADAVEYAESHETTMPVDLRQYLTDRFAGLEHQELVGPLRERGRPNGLLVRHGYIVAEWGDTERVDMTFSVTKSYLATLGGLAWGRGLLGDWDDPVGDRVHDGGYDSPQNAPITWRQTFQQTSEWEGTLFGKPDQADRREGVDRTLQPPGTFWEYNDVRVNRAALSLLRVWGEPLPRVLKREIMDPIGASDTWEWHGYETSWVELDGDSVQSVSGGGHWGGGLFIHSRDHARFGLLMSRDGRWGDRQIVPAEWIREATTPSIEPTYGFMWWLNTDPRPLSQRSRVQRLRNRRGVHQHHLDRPGPRPRHGVQVAGWTRRGRS